MCTPVCRAIEDLVGQDEKKVFFLRNARADRGFVPKEILIRAHDVFPTRCLTSSNPLNHTDDNKKARAIRDPALTLRGQKQAMMVGRDWLLRHVLAASAGGELIVISPLRRSIWTAIGAFGPWIAERAAAGNPVHVAFNLDIQACNEDPRDTGRPTSELRSQFASQFPFLPFDTLPEKWYLKQDYEFSESSLAARFARFARWIQQRPESTIIVVGHHDVFAYMLNERYANAEVRLHALPKIREDGGNDRNDELLFSSPWRPVWPPPLPPRSFLGCASPECKFSVHTLPEFGDFCCHQCASGLPGHGQQCECKVAPQGSKKLNARGSIDWTQEELLVQSGEQVAAN